MTTKTIYGWHIIHTETGTPYAFCVAEGGLIEFDVLSGMDADKITLVSLIRAGVV